MVTHLLAVLALAALCGAWITLQLWLKRVDPGQPGLDRPCGGSCAGRCAERLDCRRDLARTGGNVARRPPG